MAETPRILAFAGSAREGSFNRKLVSLAAEGARKAGAEVTVVDLADYPLPLFDQDLEAREGLPENAAKLKELFASHDGLLIASPEYNSSISPLLKNTIDWVSRKETPEEPMLAAYAGKVAVVMSASPGALGGLRSLRHIREILCNINVIVLPEQLGVPSAHEAFAPDGSVPDQKLSDRIMMLGARLTMTLGKLA